MDCGECRAMLLPLHDGRLDADETADVAAHLEGCRACRAERTVLLRADDLVSRAAEPAGRTGWDDFRARVLAARDGLRTDPAVRSPSPATLVRACDAGSPGTDLPVLSGAAAPVPKRTSPFRRASVLPAIAAGVSLSVGVGLWLTGGGTSTTTPSRKLSPSTPTAPEARVAAAGPGSPDRPMIAPPREPGGVSAAMVRMPGSGSWKDLADGALMRIGSHELFAGTERRAAEVGSLVAAAADRLTDGRVTAVLQAWMRSPAMPDGRAGDGDGSHLAAGPRTSEPVTGFPVTVGGGGTAYGTPSGTTGEPAAWPGADGRTVPEPTARLTVVGDPTQALTAFAGRAGDWTTPPTTPTTQPAGADLPVIRQAALDARRRAALFLVEVRDVNAADPLAVELLAGRIRSEDLVGRLMRLQVEPALSDGERAALTHASALLVRFTSAHGTRQFADVAAVQGRLMGGRQP